MSKLNRLTLINKSRAFNFDTDTPSCTGSYSSSLKFLIYVNYEPRGLSCGSTLNTCQDVSKSANLIHVQGFGDCQSHSVVIRNAKSCDGSWLEAVYFIFLILHPNFHELSQSLKVFTLNLIETRFLYL